MSERRERADAHPGFQKPPPRATRDQNSMLKLESPPEKSLKNTCVKTDPKSICQKMGGTEKQQLSRPPSKTRRRGTWCKKQLSLPLQNTRRARKCAKLNCVEISRVLGIN